METAHEHGDSWADELGLSEDGRIEAVAHWTAIRNELPFIDKRLTEINQFSSMTDPVSTYRLKQAKHTLQEHIARIDQHSDAYKEICGRRPLPLTSQLSDRVMFDLATGFHEPVNMQSLAEAIDKVSSEVENLTRQGMKLQYLDDGAEPNALGRSMQALETAMSQPFSVIRFGLIAIDELIAESTATESDREVAKLKRTDWEFLQGQLQGLQTRFAAEHQAIKEGTATENTVNEVFTAMWEPFRELLAKVYTLHAESYVLNGADEPTFDLQQATETVGRELAEARKECQGIASVLREDAPWLPIDMTSLTNSGGLSQVRGFPTLLAMTSTYQESLRAQYRDEKRVEEIRQAMLVGDLNDSKHMTELRSLIEQAQTRFSLLHLYSSTYKWAQENETDMPGMKVSDVTRLIAEWRELENAAVLSVVGGCADLLRSRLPASLGLDSNGNRVHSSGARYGKGKAAV